MSEKRNPRWVYVRDSEQEEWVKRILIDRTRKDGYECVCATYEKDYMIGRSYHTLCWRYMREIANFKLFRQNIFLEDL